MLTQTSMVPPIRRCTGIWDIRRLLAPQAAESDLCSGRSGPPESLVRVRSPWPKPLSTFEQGRPASSPALHFWHAPCTSLPPRRRPQLHAANWRLPPTRLEPTMFIFTLSSTISESASQFKSQLFDRTVSRRHAAVGLIAFSDLPRIFARHVLQI